MSTLSHSVVTPGAYLTLHYRMSAAGNEIVSTFSGTPATLQVGGGQLAPFLEQCLLGLQDGAHCTFEFEPGTAFGERNPDLLQRVTHGMLRQHSVEGEQYAVGDVVEFAAPGGGRFAGVMREWSEDSALFDFNHPLAGQPIEFEVKIIGIL